MNSGAYDAIACVLMRGGTSKGAYFLADDLPEDPAARDELLLRVMGSPDPRQIDGVGGAHPLTSKVAVVSRSPDPAIADVDYLFLQVQVDRPLVSARQPCGNILAGVGPFALAGGLLDVPGGGAARGSDSARDGTSHGVDSDWPTERVSVRIRMVNTGKIAVASFPAPARPGALHGGEVEVDLEFRDTAGSVCGSLLPTGAVRDEIDGIAVTCVDNGMPVVLVAAADLGVRGDESCALLEADEALAARREALRLKAGRLMGLGDVTDATIPKVTLIAPPRHGGAVATRTFIPHRCHASIGVFGAVSVATGALLPGSVGEGVAVLPGADGLVRVEHPSGYFDTRVITNTATADTAAQSVAVVRTARVLFAGTVFPRAAREARN